MNKCFGIVAEFNPFHNGHAALCHHAREMGAEAIVAVMSGNFAQRGEITVTDKHVRTKAALLGGVDLVLELPLPWAMATAQRFSSGAVSILKATGCVDTLCFGSECGDLELLRRIALAVDDYAVKKALRAFLFQGFTFARARQLAVEQVHGKSLSACLAEPNNILGVEYLRQASALNWAVDAVTAKRVGSRHDSGTPVGQIASASYLRGLETLDAWANYVPPASMETYRQAASQGRLPARQDKLETAILSHLRHMGKEELVNLPDLSEGLENRLYKAIRSASSLEEMTTAIKSKRYPLARIRRLILSAFLGISKWDGIGLPPYIRVLGFNGKGRGVLERMKGNAIPVHTSLIKLGTINDDSLRLTKLEAAAGDQYALALPHTAICGAEYTESAIFLKP